MTKVMLAGKLIALLLLAGACIEPYDPPIRESNTHYLVVDGFLNTGNGEATVYLTRTQDVKSEDVPPAVTGAVVSIEDNAGNIFMLNETGEGRYGGMVAGAGTDKQYRLNIRTSSLNQYSSELVQAVETPPIDSITWSVKNEGVEIAVNTHDPSGRARNFRWHVTETYQYNVNFDSRFMFEGANIVPRPHDQAIFTCWRTVDIADIKVTSTKHLEQSVVSRFPLMFIPGGSRKISVKYSVLVHQQALTEEAYNYWLSLERSTEHLGGLFDPLPTAVESNMRNVNDPGETVVGYFSAGNIRERRMFLSSGQLPREINRLWRNPYCEQDTILFADLDEVYQPGTVITDEASSSDGFVIGYLTATPSCADCRTYQGVTQRPYYWE